MGDMASTRLFRDQHKELKRLSIALRLHLTGPVLGRETLQAFQAYIQALRSHLAMEDRGIYPQLLVHKSEQIRLMAQIYQAEMGSLGRDFDALVRQWEDLSRIELTPLDFARVLNDMLDRLEHRMEREDHGLYALVDRLD